jgi:aminoglycoside 6-adenylyltransferase
LIKGMQAELHDPVLEQLVRWGERQTLVRAMLLTSTRAIPGAQPDALSDYDVILALEDIRPFHEQRAWLEDFGHVLALYHDPLMTEHGLPSSAYVVQFEGKLKIDFTLWQAGVLPLIIAEAELPAEMDAGYLVLLDKDNLTAGLKPPSYRAYIPKPPSEGEYLEAVDSFYLEVIYMAKFLWRDDLIAAKYMLDQFMKHEHLIPMLVWGIEIERGWSLKPGLYGRRLKQFLRPELWAELEQTYTGLGVEENWLVLERTMALFQKTGREVGAGLGYTYPEDLDRRAHAHIQWLRTLGHGHTDISI